MKCKGAVVTGASGGIGSQIVRELCGEGFHVVAGYKNDRASAEALCAEMREQGFLAEAFCADVSNPAQAVRLAEAAAARFGGIELLVNNAGVSLFALSQETTDEEYDLVFDTNMRGVFNMCRAVIPSMIRAE
ncbi:MAG: SDR family NAD(P)-dependent oxidoreductase, partial [Oscillospiraceae bacterium]